MMKILSPDVSYSAYSKVVVCSDLAVYDVTYVSYVQVIRNAY
jgi:hypothetical protein